MTLAAPFVNYEQTPTADINSTPVIIFASQVGCAISSIRVCNTGRNDILVTVTLLAERNLVAGNYYLIKGQSIQPSTSVELILGSPINMKPGDILYGNADYSGDSFDCIVSYREFNQLTGN